MSDDRRRSQEERRTPDLDAQLLDVVDDYMDQFVPNREETEGIRDRILHLVRNDLYRGPSTRLRTGEGHEFSIASAAVRSIVRDAVDTVTGIRARSVRIVPAGEPEGSAAEVALTVTMRADIVVAEAATSIRTAVSEALAGDLGVPAERIDIEVEDAYVE